MNIRIATRKSELALWQAEHVAARLRELSGVDSVSLIPLTTRGDEILDKSLAKIGGKGLFIKELEVAMQADEADIAVHSMKDVPAVMPEGFAIAAVLKRANPSDALLTRTGESFAALQPGARIGSSSLRRKAQLLAMRQDVDVIPLRGNVNTRLRKLADGDYDAIVLAAAGLDRLGFADQITETFATAQMLPAAAQGVIGIECLDGRTDLKALLKEIEDPESHVTTAAERAVTETLDASCQSPVAAYARLDAGVLTVDALVATEDGQTQLTASACGSPDNAKALGTEVATKLLADGARELLAGAPD